MCKTKFSKHFFVAKTKFSKHFLGAYLKISKHFSEFMEKRYINFLLWLLPKQEINAGWMAVNL